MTARNAPKAERPEESPGEEGDGILRIGEDAEEPRYEVLFRLDGREYKFLANPDASLMLAYFSRMRKQGSNLAFSWVLEKMCPEDTYEALTESGKVSRADFRKVADTVLSTLLGNAAAVPK